MQYIKNFTKERSNKIGASDISKLIQHPEKSESLYGYDETALTLWQEKTGKIKREPARFSAEMGNALEPVVLRKFISENIDKETAEKFYRGYVLCELNKTDDGYLDAENFQNTNWPKFALCFISFVFDLFVGYGFFYGKHDFVHYGYQL